MTERKEPQEESHRTEVVDLTVTIFVFDQAANLTVNQAIKLADQYNVVSIFPVLGKKVGPLLAAPVIPGTTVKDKLAFIYDKPGLSLDDFTPLIPAVTQTGEVQEPVSRKVKVILVKKEALFLRGNEIVIDIKIRYHILSVIELEVNVLCNMVGLPGAGSTRIKINHKESLLVSHFSSWPNPIGASR